MRALVIYESMYGNTHTVAEHIGTGLAAENGITVEVVPVGDATPERLAAADLVVVGGPTHIHGMTTEMSRHQAVAPETLAHEEDKGHHLEVDPDAEGPGLRDWFDGLEKGQATLAAAFDTRMHGPGALTGRAGKGITKRLHRHGFTVVADPESFLVDGTNHLDPGEVAHAEQWGRDVKAAAARRTAGTAS
ncbi:MAG TPA: flavodoxin domain-containing protein [Acidimicrobiales bacterium]|nr:flavodoxin domain-containing protein [Acidimicrobiales bacterium]